MKAERLYEQARKELADSPKEELLRKSISEADGDEEKGKALYVETRVKELEEEDDLEDLLVHSTSCVLGETIKSLWPDYDKEVKEMLEEEEEEEEDTFLSSDGTYLTISELLRKDSKK